MRRLIAYAALLALAIVAFGPAGPAQAQATRTWVSGVGDDANPCSRTAPCKTFAGAISKTAAGGEISVLDPGGFGAVTITKSISIINDYSGEAGILASGGTGVIVNAGVNDVVILRGLVIDGAPPGTPGLHGIRFLAGAALHVEKCLIKNFVSTAAGAGNGILFAPAGTSELFVSNTTLINNGATAAAAGNGILIQPSGAGVAKVSLNRVQMENNRVGLRADSTTTTGSVIVAMNDSTAVGNTNIGVVSAANGTASTIIINNSVVSNNATNGLVASGSNATLRVGGSLITGNGTATLAQSSGVLTSYKNNIVDGNTNNTTPITGSALN